MCIESRDMTTRATPDVPPIPEDDWITRPEAAVILRVSVATIDRYARSGALTRFRTPGGGTRFGRTEVEGLIRPERASA